VWPRHIWENGGQQLPDGREVRIAAAVKNLRAEADGQGDMIQSLAHKIVSNPKVYDWVQKAAGADTVGRFVAPHLTETAGHLLLDVGGGTGSSRALMPESTRYIWMDNDAQKLSGFRRKRPLDLGAMGAATQLSFRNKSVDYGLCMAVLHHLTDSQLGSMLDELARVLVRRLIVLDPLECTERLTSNMLWKYDRGSFPRTNNQIRAALERRFQLEHVAELTVYHRYILCVASPKT
jgi:ubiquinone/menaquinone biosynthesis C-methylase UbiE